MTVPPEGEAVGPSMPASTSPEAGADGEPAAAGEERSSPGPEAGTPPAPIPWFRVLPGCLLAWAVPGLGHVVLGRFGRGLLLGGLILALFAGGLALDGKVYRPVDEDPLSYLAAFGAAGVGVPFLIAHARGLARGDLTSAYHDYGNTFTLVAGLLNLLLVLDAYDVALGRR